MYVYFDVVLCFFFKQKTAYEMRISDWSSDVCSSDLRRSVTILLADVARHRRRRCHCPGHQDRLEQARTLALALRLRQFRCNNDTTLDTPDLAVNAVHGLIPLRILMAKMTLATRLAAGRSMDRSEEHTSELQSLMR